MTANVLAVPRDKRLSYKRAWEKWKRGTGPKPTRPSEAIQLDSGPLVSFLAREHHRVWHEAYWTAVAAGSKARGVPRGKTAAQDHSALRTKTKAVDRQARWVLACCIAGSLEVHPNVVHQHIQKWRQGKPVNVWLADRIIAAFGRHISEVYGSEWEDQTA